MSIASESVFARRSRAVYEALLIFYPRDLRHKFGAEMAEVFEALIRDAVLGHGLAETISLWRSALWELLTVALPLRLASNAVVAGAISFLVSSVLFLVFFRAVT